RRRTALLRGLTGACPGDTRRAARGMPMRYVIAPLRVLLLLLHVVDGVLITGLIYPFIGQPTRNRIKRAWARVLLWLAGVRVTVSGLVPERKFGATGVRGGGATGVLLLVNHVSWI